MSLNWQLKKIFLNLSFKIPQNHDLFIFIEVGSSTFEVRVRLDFSQISSRCSKFGHAKVGVFKVRNFWVRSNTITYANIPYLNRPREMYFVYLLIYYRLVQPELDRMMWFSDLFCSTNIFPKDRYSMTNDCKQSCLLQLG